MSGILDALGYVADSLAKPGRAVRGVLGGRPDEALAALPFSDTLGITDQANQVTGHDLLTQLGFDPGDGLGGTLAGVGVDVATDPLTYAGGYLARRLLGGGFRPQSVGMGEKLGSDVYDLAQPWERNVSGEARLAGSPVAPHTPTVDLAQYDFPVVPDSALPVASGRLTELPLVDDYAAFLNYGPDSGLRAGPFRTPSVPQGQSFANDVLQETGDATQAFRTSLGAWNDAIGDISGGSQQVLRDLGATGAVPTEEGRRWQDVIARRWADLDAVRKDPQLLSDPTLLPIMKDQLERLAALRSAEHGSPLRSSAANYLGDLKRGDYAPSRVNTEYTHHLPLDESQVRRLAADGQYRVVDRQLDEIYERLGNVVGYDNPPLDAVVDLASTGMNQPHSVAADLSLLLPGHFANPGSNIEPSVVKAVFDSLDPAVRYSPAEILHAIRQLRARGV